MNPMTNVKNIQRLGENELKRNSKKSWHDQYKDSAWVFIGGLAYDMTEGDIICVFSQFGEPVNINLVRDKDTGKSKGYCFLCYEDQRSSNLAVDNLNGIKLLNRTIRVDHVENYKAPKDRKTDDEETRKLKKEGCGANIIEMKVDTIKREEISTMTLKVRKDEKKKKSKKESSSESDSTSEEEINTKIKKDKGKIHKKVLEKKKKYTKEKDGKRNKKNESSDSEQDKRKKHRKKKDETTSDSESTSSEEESEESDANKKHKRNPTIDELKREARLIKEELKRRQLAKHSEESDYKNDEKTRDSSRSRERKEKRKDDRDRSRSRERKGRDDCGKRQDGRSRPAGRRFEEDRYKDDRRNKRNYK